MVTDEDYMIPILMKINHMSAVYNQIPLRHHFCKSWIIFIQDEQPITVNGYKEAFHHLQQNSPRNITITFYTITDPIRYD